MRRGLFGNRLRTWETVAAVRADAYTGLLSIRSMIPSAPFLHKLAQEDAFARVTNLPPGSFTLCEPAQDDALLLQGEVQRSIRGLDLFCGTEQTDMRSAIRMGAMKQIHGLRASETLRTYLWSSDYLDLMELLDSYNDAVVEFSAYDRGVGCIPHRNTVIWEVRHY